MKGENDKNSTVHQTFNNLNMIDLISKHVKSSQKDYTFCVLIPSWNNLDYLKLCIGSIQKNSHFDVQIVVIVNEGIDNTLGWLKEQPEIDCVHAKINIGICFGLNIARSLIKSEYIVYVNDDMYLLPNWDLELYNEIQQLGTRSFMLSATMIEPFDTGNPCVVVKDYGRDLTSFNEDLLMKEYAGLTTSDWSGSMWPPNVVHIDLWDLVGGMSIEFSPGMYSDPDLARKLFEAGVRIFKGKGTSLVYHFGSKTTKRLRKNWGKKIFLLKWGITPKTFTTHYLKLGNRPPAITNLPVLNTTTRLVNFMKRIRSSCNVTKQSSR
jgi:glycosyltransferase involved in cell wall biosynthesis